MAQPRIAAIAGDPETLGVTRRDGEINVAVVSRNATSIAFCLFDERGERETHRLPLPRVSDAVFAATIAGVDAGAHYGLRADGPDAPGAGNYFDPAKLLVDPYATALDRPFAYDDRLCAPRAANLDTAPLMPKAIVSPGMAARNALPAREPGFIYEVSVKAFSAANPAIPRPLRGTVAALRDPASLDHLVRLGVDTVELMPVAAWIDERHLVRLGLSNAWGYNPVAFMAPDPRLAPGGLIEVAETVSALHEAGIAVILDAVFNHTGEGEAGGPTLSLRGLDNALYFRHADDGTPINDTGTGNTLATERPEVARLALDAMRQWALGTGIDGFRLDLAATLGRTSDGFRQDAPLLAAIEADPLLNTLMFIAEPWDIGPGGYQLGNFPKRWYEWNDKYRDDVRRFWRGDTGALGALATRLAGSADAFQRDGQGRTRSINFVAAHDGFALADVAAYANKHNALNGEENHDGNNANFSWNNGIEGASGDPVVRAQRRADVKALLATLFLSRGEPMLTAGDELGRTQAGNNNAYAQDNATTWLNWTSADLDLADFTARLAALRQKHPALREREFLTGAAGEDGLADVTWLNLAGQAMRPQDWDGAEALGVVLGTAGDRVAFWINGGQDALEAHLPAARAGNRWVRALTSREPKEDDDLRLAPRSVTIWTEMRA